MLSSISTIGTICVWNSACAHETSAVSVIRLIDVARGNTSTEHLVGRGGRTLVGTCRLDIIKRMC